MLLSLDYLKDSFSLDIKGVLHIGAHHGQEYQIYKKHNIKNLVFFEPLSNNFAKLKTNVVETSSVKLVNKALGNQNTMVKMYVESANQGQSSSVLKPNLHLKQYPHIVFNKTEMVEMVKLDDFCETLSTNDYNMINMDVQGYELEVLKGGERFLEHIDYIVSEVNRAPLYNDNVFVEELDEFLSERGFTRVVTDWQGGTWGDALYIRNK